MKISFLTKLKTYFFSLVRKEENKIEVKNSKDSFQCSITIPKAEYEKLDPKNYCPDCGQYQYGCAGNYFWPCLKYKETILSKLSEEDRREIKEVENNEELSKRYRAKLINELLERPKVSITDFNNVWVNFFSNSSFQKGDVVKALNGIKYILIDKDKLGWVISYENGERLPDPCRLPEHHMTLVRVSNFI